jgi:SlyX protein
MANSPLDHHHHINERMNSLEMRNAFQDDVIEQLNSELANHQEEIADLKQQLKLIAGRIKEIHPAEQSDNEAEPPPPHY